MTHRRSESHSAVLTSAVLFLMLTGSAHSQQAGSNGTYGELTLKVGNIRNSGATFAGGRGGWTIDRTYGVGIGGYWLVNNVPARAPDTAGDSRLMISYGGLDFEYLMPIDSSFQVSAQALVGGGAVGRMETHYSNPRPRYDPFIVFEPGMNVEAGMTKVFRLVVSGSYRLVGRLSSSAATRGDVAGPVISISIKAGFF